MPAVENTSTHPAPSVTAPDGLQGVTRLQRWQAATGLFVAVFVTLHLVNTWLAVFGPTVYNPVQQAFGSLYQWLPFEALLILAIYSHLIIGITRIVREPKRKLTARSRWHRYSGIFLALVITGHIGAVRGASWFADVWPRFDGIAFTLDYLGEVFLPYYFSARDGGLLSCAERHGHRAAATHRNAAGPVDASPQNRNCGGRQHLAARTACLRRRLLRCGRRSGE